MDKVRGFASQRRGLGMGKVARLVAVAAGMVATLLAAAPARADGDPVNSFFGAFGTAVPIEVPKFRGLEPALSLGYSSDDGDGLLGVGWSLGGFSSIERAAPGHGAPTYTSSDLFFIDGEELVADASMGCQYSTKIKNYACISFNATTDAWTVVGTNGHKATYLPVYVVSKGVFRWGLSSVADPRGNTVSYAWWDDGLDAYPSRVSYNGATVSIYREARPDPIVFTTGAGTGQTSYRIKTVDVAVGGSRARSYKLSYATSAATSRSVLTAIQQFGRDAVLDSTGTVTGGTALPAETLTPSSGATSIDGWGWTSSGAYSSCEMLFGDFNGDGKTDLYCHRRPGDTNPDLMALATPGGFTGWLWSSSGPYSSCQILLGDFNGDGKTDLYCNRYAGDTEPDLMALSTGSGFTGWTWQSSGPYSSCQMLAGDFDGDGKSDLYCHRRQGDSDPDLMALSTGSGFTGWSWASSGPYSSCQIVLGDFNGDGRSDLYCSRYAGDTSSDLMALSTGSGFTGWGWTSPGPYSSCQILVGDFNGDGKSDIYCSRRKGDTNPDLMALSTGAGFTAWQWSSGSSYSSCQIKLGDFNADGRADIYCSRYAGDVTSSDLFAVSTGSGFTPWLWTSPGSFSSCQLSVADFDGDGKSDVYCSRRSGDSSDDLMALGAPGVPDLVSSLYNGLGGATTISYAPSSAYSNTYLPVGMVFQAVSAVTTTDGRGASTTASYQYEGGLWSATERRYLGFRYAKSVIDAAGDYSETYYHQDVGCISKPDTTYFRSATGALYSYSTMAYAESAGAPYTSLMTSRWDYQCEQGSACRRSLIQFGYDQYANVTLEEHWGDYDVTGDEVTVARGYSPNVGAYLVSFPAYENRYTGIGTTGTLRRQVLYEYDGATAYTTAPTVGNRTAALEWNDATGAYLTTTYAYDSFGNRVGLTPMRGGTQTTTFDAAYHVFPVRECDALGHCATTAWDVPIESVSSKTDANGGVTTHTFDPLARPLSETAPDGHLTSFAYVNWGNPASQHLQKTVSDGSSAGIWEETYYDGLQRPWQRVRKDGTVQSTLYDDTSGRAWQQSYWYSPEAGETPRYTINAYDGAGRLVAQTLPDGSRSSSTFLAGAGFAEVVHVDALGNQRATWADAYGHTTQVVEVNAGASVTTRYTVDPFGVVTAATDPNGNQSTFAFNSLGWKLRECLPDVGCLTYGYDTFGDLVTRTDARGNVITFQYDALGRKVEEVYPDATALSWAYEQAGHGAAVDELTSSADLDGTSSYTYDLRGRVTAATRCIRGTCYSTSRSYNLAGQVASDTYPDGEVVEYGYDARGRLTSVEGASSYVASIGYDSNDHVVSETFGNGVTAAYTYDPSRQWLDTANVKSGATVLYDASYGYDRDGRVTTTASTTDATLNVAYTYDALSRLTAVSGAQTQAFAYDAIGNLTSSTSAGAYTYGLAARPHAVTATSATGSYTYDASGNMLTAPGATYAWSYDSHLLTSTSATGTSTYGYDAAGERVYEQDAAGHATLYFGPMFEVSSGVVVKHYFAGAQRVARSSAGTLTFWHADHLGSVRVATDATGKVAGTHTYAPYGATLATTGAADTSVGFDGQRVDASGLVYMNARYYAPAIGKFISPDSFVPGSGSTAFNRYAFAADNPVCNTDPSGHVPVIAIAVAVISASAGVEGLIAGATGLALAVDLCETVGGAMSIAGAAAHSALLSTIGSVLLGFSGGSSTWGYVLGSGAALGGALVGAGIAAATSPLSPLDPGLRQAIGWAYAAASLGAVMYKEVASTAVSEDQQLTAYKGKYGNATECTTASGGNVVYSYTPDGGILVSVASRNAEADQEAIAEIAEQNPGMAIKIDSRLISPATNAAADMGAGPGSGAAQEEGKFFNPLDRALPWSSNVTGYVHEVVYEAISRILGGWEGAAAPLGTLSVADTTLMYIAEALAVPTLLVTAAIDLVSQGLGIGPYAPGSGTPTPIW